MLDLHREEASHVGFGHGPHRCVGAPLARRELQVAPDTLLRRLPGLRFAVTWDAPTGRPSPEPVPKILDSIQRGRHSQ